MKLTAVCMIMCVCWKWGYAPDWGAYPHFQHRSTAFKAMPIDLSLVVERELATRAKKAVFDAWRRDTARRNRVVGRWISWMQLNGTLVRALLRFWAGRPVQDSSPTLPVQDSSPTLYSWIERPGSWRSALVLFVRIHTIIIVCMRIYKLQFQASSFKCKSRPTVMQKSSKSYANLLLRLLLLLLMLLSDIFGKSVSLMAIAQK